MRIAGAIAVYGILLWLMRPLGMIGIVAALISGTTAGGIILLARRQDVMPLVRLTTYILIGVIFGAFILGEMMMPRKAWQGPPELSQLKGAIIGVLMGAVIAILINDSHRKPDD